MRIWQQGHVLICFWLSWGPIYRLLPTKINPRPLEGSIVCCLLLNLMHLFILVTLPKTKKGNRRVKTRGIWFECCKKQRTEIRLWTDIEFEQQNIPYTMACCVSISFSRQKFSLKKRQRTSGFGLKRKHKKAGRNTETHLFKLIGNIKAWWNWPTTAAFRGRRESCLVTRKQDNNQAYRWVIHTQESLLMGRITLT